MKKFLMLTIALVLTLASCGSGNVGEEGTNGETENHGTSQITPDITTRPDTEADTTERMTEGETEITTEGETEPPIPDGAYPTDPSYMMFYDMIDIDSITYSDGFMAEETGDLVFDDDVTTKWCTKKTEDGIVTLEWSMSEPVNIRGYVIVTANDSPERTPESWILYGGASSDSLAPISTVDSGELPEDVYSESEVFLLDSPGEYSNFKLVVSSTRGEVDLVQFSELILLG